MTRPNKKNVLNVQNMIKIALLSAIAFVLTLPLFRWSLPIFPGFLSLDVSDLPAIIGMVVLGPLPAVWIIGLKNILDILITGSSSAGIGPLANFLVGTAYILPLGFIFHKQKNRVGFAIGAAAGVISATVMAGVFNITVLIPTYARVLEIPIEVIIGMGSAINPNIDSLASLVLLSIVPFNLLKFGLVSVVGFILYMAFMPVLAAISKK